MNFNNPNQLSMNFDTNTADFDVFIQAEFTNMIFNSFDQKTNSSLSIDFSGKSNTSGKIIITSILSNITDEIVDSQKTIIINSKTLIVVSNTSFIQKTITVLSKTSIIQKTIAVVSETSFIQEIFNVVLETFLTQEISFRLMTHTQKECFIQVVSTQKTSFISEITSNLDFILQEEINNETGASIQNIFTQEIILQEKFINEKENNCEEANLNEDLIISQEIVPKISKKKPIITIQIKKQKKSFKPRFSRKRSKKIKKSKTVETTSLFSIKRSE